MNHDALTDLTLKKGLGSVAQIVIAPSGDTSGARDAANINAALTALISVQLLQGTYYINASLVVGSFQTLQGSGAGPGGTIINMVGTAGSAIVISTPNPNTTVAAGSNTVVVNTFAGAGVLNVASTAGFAAGTTVLFVSTSLGTACIQYTGKTGTTFTGCTFISGPATGAMSTGGAVNQAPSSGGVINPTAGLFYLHGPGTGSGTGISGGSPWNVIEGLACENLIIDSMGARGIDLNTVIASRFDNVDIASCGTDGFRLSSSLFRAVAGAGPGTPTSVTIRDNYVHSCGGHGYWLQDTNYSALVGCASDANGSGGGHAFLIDTCQNVALVGCGAENNALHGFVVSASTGISLTSCMVAAGATGSHAFRVLASTKCSMISCTELNVLGAPAASFSNDGTSDCLFVQPQYVTAPSFAGSYQQILNGATTLRTVTTTGVTNQLGGVSSAGSAPVLTPAFANGVAGQLADTARDYMVYLEVTTAGTATSVAIGPANTTTTTIMAAAAATAGQVIAVRLPAGWWLKWTGTTTAFGTQTAIGC